MGYSGGGPGGGGGAWGQTTGRQTSDPNSGFEPTRKGKFWRGTDNKVWVAGEGGTSQAGNWDTNTRDYWSNLGYTQTADPITPVFPGTAPTVAEYGGDALKSTTGGSYEQSDMDYLNNQLNQYSSLSDLIPTYLQTGLNKLNSTEEDARNRAELQNSRAMRDYGYQREDTQNSKNQAIGTVNTNARTLADSLRRMLGMASGANSSAYKITAPNAVARQAAGQRSNVMNRYGRNERDLDSAMGDTKVDFNLILKDIADRRKQEEEDLRAGIYGQEQSIASALAEIEAEKARLMGGDSLSAMQPYQDQYNTLLKTIADLPNKYAVSPARDLNVAKPQLRDYVVDRQAINASGNMGQSVYSPYAQFLTRNRDEEERLA